MITRQGDIPGFKWMETMTGDTGGGILGGKVTPKRVIAYIIGHFDKKTWETK